MVNIKYTTITRLLEVNNDMVHNFYYIYYGRIYNEDKTRYRRFKYIEWFDMFDVQEYYEKDWITQDDINNYALTLENSYLLMIKDYNDIQAWYDFSDHASCKLAHSKYKGDINGVINFIVDSMHKSR